MFKTNIYWWWWNSKWTKFMVKGKSKRVVTWWNLFANLENHLRLVKDGNEIKNCCEGRLSNANKIPYETRLQTLLARKHKLTRLIVLDCHQRLRYAG